MCGGTQKEHPDDRCRRKYRGRPALVTEIRGKLEETLSIAKAAESCARDGSVDRAVQILMDFEGLVHEARDLFKAALTIKRNLFAETA
ncbi:hypothetical protein [Afipia clevelandensis]|uniref:hypothetical protein n=1 Tax=Afipia clevelandensis TaxID=1034 RepID=UPI001FDA9A80|nr:hypothetical protein [Afipia clevelandensis]